MRPGGATTLLGIGVLLVVVLLQLLVPRSASLPAAADPSPAASEPAEEQRASTAPASPQASATIGVPTVTLVGAGDIASCSSSGDEVTAALLDAIAGTIFTTGDNVYDRGTTREYEDCYGPSWGRHRDRTRPAPGNHDYGTRGAAGYYEYFGAAAGDPSDGWYAYDLGAWRAYALNSNCDAVGGCHEGSRQERWLRADLAAHPRACVLAYWHHPLFSSGEHGNHPAVRPLFAALHDAGAELVLAGHDHSYERFAPQAPNGAADPDRGILQIVVGTGGKSHYGFREVRANSLVRHSGTNGVLKLTLGDGTYAFEFVPEPGSTFSDSGEGTCH